MSAINSITKICKNCKIEKSTSDFYVQKQVSDGGKVWMYYDTFCIKCRIEYSHDRRKNIKIRSIIYMGGACNDCGYSDINHPEVFDFHHSSPQLKDFTMAKSSRSFESIKSELDKCILLCANCHRIRHSIT